MLRIDGALRPVAQFDYEEWLPRGNARDVALPVNEYCIETEGGVGWLLHCRRQLGEAVCLSYRDRAGWSCQMRATLIGVSRGTLHRRISEAHVWLYRYFEDRRRGVPSPQMHFIK